MLHNWFPEVPWSERFWRGGVIWEKSPWRFDTQVLCLCRGPAPRPWQKKVWSRCCAEVVEVIVCRMKLSRFIGFGFAASLFTGTAYG